MGILRFAGIATMILELSAVEGVPGQSSNAPSGSEAHTIARAVANTQAGTVCDAAPFSARGATAETVIASLDYSGRGACNDVVRILPGNPPTEPCN